MAVGDPYNRVVGFDPGGKDGVHIYDQRLFATGGNTGRTDVGINDLSAKELLESMKTDLLEKLMEERDNAKFLYEEESDEASFGEYMGLEKAVGMVEKYIIEAPARIYSRPAKQEFSSLKYLAQSYQPPGHTTGNWGGLGV